MIMKHFLSSLMLCFLCITASAQDSIYVVKNYPNPFNGTTNLHLAVASEGETTVLVTDMLGNIRSRLSRNLEPGIHNFQISVRPKGNYVLNAHHNGKNASLVMICKEGASTNRIDYKSMIGEFPMEVKEDIILEECEAEEDSVDIIMDVNNDTYIKQPTTNKRAYSNSPSKPFRIALSLSPFSMNQFEQGYIFKVGEDTAETPAQLQQIYKNLGSTEMYVRLATKRHISYNTDGTLNNIVDGKEDENANVHTLDQVIKTCKLAAQLNIPINPEVMCAYTYMDVDKTQAPRFEEYPEIYALQKGKKWEEMSMEEICTVLEAYGEFVGRSILATGCTVKDWNIGNEANFGFAGIGIGAPNAFDKKLARAGTLRRYLSPLFGIWWLKKHVWKYEAQALAAVRSGILNAYEKAGKDTTDLKFSTHIATVISTPRCSAAFFKYMAKHGYDMQTAGISYYPSAPAMTLSRKKMLKRTVNRINKKNRIPVFIAEFSYPSGEMEGPFAGWNKKLGDYDKSQQGQAEIYKDVIQWGKSHGLIGVRYWAPDYKGWYSMSMFEFDNKKVGTAKKILLNHKEIVK